MNELSLRPAQLMEVSSPSKMLMGLQELADRALMIKEVQAKLMKADVHYGVIPGTAKPTLYQPGAQTLCVAFGLVAEFFPEPRELPGDHREWLVKTVLRNMSGAPVGYGYGSCSTMENKFRWRNDSTAGEPTGHAVPKSYWGLKDSKLKLQAARQICDDATGSFGAAKVGADGKIVPKDSKAPGEWQFVRYPEVQPKVPNEDLADCYNTVLKMATKRSLVHATLNATGASDTFTQDLEDLRGILVDIGGGGSHGQHEPEPPAPVRQDGQSGASEPKNEPGQRKAPPEPAGGAEGTPRNYDEWEGTWRAQTVRDRNQQLQKLGTLTIEQLRAIKAHYGTKDPASLDIPQKKLLANTELGIAELQGPAAAQEAIESAKDNIPDIGNNPPGPDAYPAEKIAWLRKLCQEAIITESTWLEYAHRDGLMKNFYVLENEKPIESFEDDRFDKGLDDAVASFPTFMRKWGCVTPEPTGKPAKRAYARKAKA